MPRTGSRGPPSPHPGAAREGILLRRHLHRRFGGGIADPRPHTQGEWVPLLVRFSTGGGNPIGDDGGREARGTQPWPEGRRRVSAGRIELDRPVADPEGDGEIVVFDPVNVIDGIELPEDPILHARSRAYSVSAARGA
jgi:catalase